MQLPELFSALTKDICSYKYRVASLFVFVGVEAVFYIVFRKYLVPRANGLLPPAPYRDYGNDRSRLLVRVMRRIEATCAMNQQDVAIAIHKFLADWFHVAKNQHHLHTKDAAISNFPELSPTPSTSPENSDDDDESSSSQPSLQSPASVLSQHSDKYTTAPIATTTTPANTTEPSICLYREDIDDFFAWAFFGKHYLTLLPWEMKELDNIYQVVEREQNMVFPKKPACPQQRQSESYHIAKPRCMSLEPVNAMHRPLLVYIIVGIVTFFGGMLLRLVGFRRLVASTGLVGWYRPGKTREGASSSSSSTYMPLLFFHGIAPSGLMLYLPMLLLGLATEPERPVFLFENRSISCCMDFYPLSEEQTVDGIVELVGQNLGTKNQQLSVVGHSFGSCPIAWLLASPKMSSRIHQVVLLDPVAILLSEPDVMVNFLYAQELDKIRMIASSELFTEYYLRRHFAWYNSELWLQDLKEHHNLLVCLSEQDEIINARKVREELERHASAVPEHQPTTVYWKGVGHGDCISSPSKWKQIKGLMLQQELEILQQR